MRTLLFAAFFCAACASSPPPKAVAITPATPVKCEPLVIHRGEPKEVIETVKAAFEWSGHDCVVDKDGDAVCDREDQSTPTMYFHYVKEAPAVGVIFQTMGMDISKAGSSCERAAAAIADAKASAPSLRARCEDNTLVLGVAIAIPELGMSVRELNHTARVMLYVITTTLVRIKTEALQRG